MIAIVDLANPAKLREKEEKLFSILAAAVAVTADSASISESHKHDAEQFVDRFGSAHEHIETRDFENPDYLKDDRNRCFHCQDELFTRFAFEEVVCARRIPHIVYQDGGKGEGGPDRPGEVVQ